MNDEILECAVCGLNVDNVLGMSCEHNPCLLCAAKSLGNSFVQAEGLNYIYCQICGEQTLVDPKSYEILLGFQEENSVESVCKEHNNEPLICQCNCLCVECFLHGRHKTHDVRNVKRALGALKEISGELLKEINHKEEILQGDWKKLEKKREEILKKVDEAKNRIMNSFESIYEVLENKRKELFATADNLLNTKLTEIDSAEQILQKELEILDKHANKINDLILNTKNELQAFSYFATNKDKIKQDIENTRIDVYQKVAPVLGIQCFIENHEIEELEERLRSLKISVLGIRGLEDPLPTNEERTMFEKAKEERLRRKINFFNKN